MVASFLYLSFFCRYCTKPKELIVECSLPTPGPLDEILECQIRSAVMFLTDHRYDPSEVYEDEFEEELKGIPDPKSDPQKILSDFLHVLHTLGISHKFPFLGER
jgi:endoribonuclease Dicer